MSDVLVTEPGVYNNMPESIYHADPVQAGSLSVSGAKRLLPPSCPAIYKWERDNGRPGKAAFDFGHAAHAAVLGVGGQTVVVQKTAKDKSVVDADDYLTKSAQEHRDAIRAEGKVPVLASEQAVIRDMVAAVRAHPIASQLLDPDKGKAEQSAFWLDDEHGIWRRGRFDWLAGRVIVDYKTCQSADPASIAKAVANYGYAMQDQWYRDAARAVAGIENPEFVFVFQQKTAPYLVTVAQLDLTAQARGRELNQRAIRTYVECMATDTWPGYVDDVALISLPKWAFYDAEEDAA